MALDSTSFCNQRGLSEINMASFNMSDAYSIYDGGALIYSRTDCFIELNIAKINVTNSMSNLISEPPFNNPRVISPMGL
jgi:hypothetical protein